MQLNFARSARVQNFVAIIVLFIILNLITANDISNQADLGSLTA